MMMFSYVMLYTALVDGELAHVLILRPFKVPEMMLSFTVISFTSFSFGYLPKLPTLSEPTPKETTAVTTISSDNQKTSCGMK